MGGRASRGGGEYELDAGVFAGVWERATLLDYGGWDERWPRTRTRRWPDGSSPGREAVCLPGMAAYYSPRNSLWGLWTQYLQYGEYREKTARRHPNTMRRSHLIAPALVLTLHAAVLAPRPISLLARVGTAAYGLALVWAGCELAQKRKSRRTRCSCRSFLALMHVGHGSGALRGAVRHGPPIEAIAEAFGIGHLRRDHAASGDPVFAPSLVLDDDDEIVRARAGAS